MLKSGGSRRLLGWPLLMCAGPNTTGACDGDGVAAVLGLQAAAAPALRAVCATGPPGTVLARGLVACLLAPGIDSAAASLPIFAVSPPAPVAVEAFTDVPNVPATAVIIAATAD